MRGVAPLVKSSLISAAVSVCPATVLNSVKLQSPAPSFVVAVVPSFVVPATPSFVIPATPSFVIPAVVPGSLVAVQNIAFLFSSRTAPQSGHLYSVFCPWNLPSLSNSNWMLKSLPTVSFAANSVPFLLLNPTRGPTALFVSSSFISRWLSIRPATVWPILKAQASFLQV